MHLQRTSLLFRCGVFAFILHALNHKSPKRYENTYLMIIISVKYLDSYSSTAHLYRISSFNTAANVSQKPPGEL